MRVLLVEDDPSTAKAIELSLASEGIVCDTTELGEEGLEIGKMYDYDIIILDLMLPDIDGYEVLRRFRAAKVTTPILILSGLSGPDQKIKGLGYGADDYLTKPFGTNELLARIRVGLRRHHAEEATPVFESDDLKVDLNKREVHLNLVPVKLTSTEYALLSVLVRNCGRVVSQNQLLTEIWGEHATEQTHYLRIYVGQLRKKLERDHSFPRHIITDPVIGYRLS